LKFGLHSLLWTEHFDLESEILIKKAVELGFDGLEIYVAPEQLKKFKVKKVKEALTNADLECIGSTALTLETDIASPNTKTRKRGINYVKDCVKLFAELGGALITGVLYTAWGKFIGRSRTEKEWVCSVESLNEICRFAQEYDITLGIEPVNRFETYFLNTTAEAVKLVKDVNADNIKIHLDTFHMNIEEKNFYDPIVKAGELLEHVHCCENDRGIVGTGNINWKEVFRALSEIKYDKWLVIESFTPEIESIANKTAIWRRLAPSAENLAWESLKYLKSMLTPF